MNRELNLRLSLILVVLVLGLISAFPNFVNVEDFWWPSKKTINYGLDIQGGLHLVMGVDTGEVIQARAVVLSENLKKDFNDNAIPVKYTKIVQGSDPPQIEVGLNKSGDQTRITQYVETNYDLLQVLDQNGERVLLRYLDVFLAAEKKKIVTQAIETIRNRIDEFGVSEPSITAQGDDRILVQLPGLEDSTKAKELINRTARLEFMLVSNDEMATQLPDLIAAAEERGNYSLATMKYSEYFKKINADLKDQLPENTRIYFERAENAENLKGGKVPYLISTEVNLSGDTIKDASVAFGEYGEPEVSMQFDPNGTRQFAEITANNVNRQLAVILDNVLKTAPNIQGAIPSGTARITLGGGRNRQKMLDEANMISISLRAGALPAQLQQLEERTVGPTLGADSIRKGKLASIVGLVLVLAFMMIYYKAFGFLADLALGINIFLVLAVLTSLEATLTLPGIAGIALTIGMAVDANVIIFERIKEEIARGAALKAAVREGYAKAFSAIMDANITTAITSIILVYFGTGPVRGFGITLLIGLGTSMFTAIFLTRTVIEILMTRFKITRLAI